MARLGGQRRIWITGAIVLAAATLGVLVALLDRDDSLTGTNSVGVRSEIAVVAAGRSLCVPDLDVPPGTGRIRFATSWPALRQPAFRVTVHTRQGTRSGGLAGADRPAPGPIAARVDVPVDGLEAGPARVCITPRGAPASIGGMFALQGDGHPLRLAGKPLDARASIWFLAPEGERQSLLSQLPDAMRRAALFRPGIIGPWLYWLGFLAVLPALWLVALRLLATRAEGERSLRATAMTIAAVAFVNAAFWALLTPAFQGPDEPDHFAFGQTLAETGEVPDKAPSGRSPYAGREVVALEAVRAFSQVGLVEARPPWLEADERRWQRRLERDPTRQDDGGGFLFPASPHGPGYYALTVPAYGVTAGASTFSQLTAMRLISALLGALAAACAFLAVRELAPRLPWLAAAAGLIVAFQPQFAFTAGVVSNDNGVNAAAALLVFLLLRGLRRGLTVRLAIALGATLVAVQVMKGTGTALWPAALVGVAGMIWRHHRRSDLPAYAALAGTLAVVQGGWALLAPAFGTKPFTTPGGGAGAGLSGTLDNVFGSLSGFVSYTWQFFLPRLSFMTDLHVTGWPAFDVYVKEGWAAFGWLVVRFPEWVYEAILVVSFAVALLALVAALRERIALRSRGWELAVLATVVACVLIGVEATQFTLTPRAVPAEQGRYVFTAIVPLAALVVGASLVLGRRLAPVGATVLVTAVMGFGLAAQLLVLTWFYA